jgi:mannose-6-phosphate isomerase-like protein (cupin superfamily)
MEIVIGNNTIVLNPGDSIMFDSQRQHGMRAMGDTPVKFLAIIS